MDNKNKVIFLFSKLIIFLSSPLANLCIRAMVDLYL